MSRVVRIHRYTFKDFCFLVNDDRKADLIDGVIYMASPDNTAANKLFMWLSALMEWFVEMLELGEVFGSRVALRLDNHNGPEPDIAFVCKERLHLVKEGHIAGPADLAVEIVSPESIERDYVKKRRQYQRAGILEYWIVDPLKQIVTLLRLDAKGKYREARATKGELHSEVIPGFWIRPEWLWKSPRPKKTKILAEILARIENRN
jgi:Uma2 family endonuclease